MSMFLSQVSLVLALSCIYCTTSFGEIKMFNDLPVPADTVATFAISYWSKTVWHSGAGFPKLSWITGR